MSVHFADLTRRAAEDGAVTEAEVLDLRRAGWADGNISREEAEAIFTLGQAVPGASAVWSDFFVEALRNYVLNGSEPRGYASEEEARWLIDQVGRDGKIASMTELELLVQVIEKGAGVPEALRDYTLGVLEQAVLSGAGPTRDGGLLAPGCVTEAEARLIRRVIFGSASDRPAAVSRREAEMLFRLKDACLSSDNAPEFERLFVQGVGNYLMGAASSDAALSRERMLELERFMADDNVSIGRFLGKMARSAPQVLGGEIGTRLFGRKSAAPATGERAAPEAKVSAGEQQWLDKQIAANGEIDRYDRALLEFIAEEAVRA